MPTGFHCFWNFSCFDHVKIRSPLIFLFNRHIRFPSCVKRCLQMILVILVIFIHSLKAHPGKENKVEKSNSINEVIDPTRRNHMEEKLGLGLAYAFTVSGNLEILYSRKNNIFKVGLTYQFTDKRGKELDWQITYPSSTIEGTGEYFSTLDFG